MTQQSSDMERVARAMEPDAWLRHDSLLEEKKGTPPNGLNPERYRASCERLAAKAIHGSVARAGRALEASHHAELVEALASIRDGHLIGSPLHKSAWETMARLQRQIARECLAKIGGGQ